MPQYIEENIPKFKSIDILSDVFVPLFFMFVYFVKLETGIANELKNIASYRDLKMLPLQQVWRTQLIRWEGEFKERSEGKGNI